MSAELTHALAVAVGSILAGAATWVRMRRGGGQTPTPTPFPLPSLTPAGPATPSAPTNPVTPSPAFPSTGRPVLDLIIQGYLAWEASQHQQQAQAHAAAFLATVVPSGEQATPPAK